MDITYSEAKSVSANKYQAKYKRWQAILRIAAIIEQQKQFGLVHGINDDVISADWYDLARIIARQNEQRSPLVLGCIEDYVIGQAYSLNILADSRLTPSNFI